MHQMVEEQEQHALLRDAEGAHALLVTPADGGNRSTDIAGTGSRTTSLSDWMFLPVTPT